MGVLHPAAAAVTLGQRPTLLRTKAFKGHQTCYPNSITKMVALYNILTWHFFACIHEPAVNCSPSCACISKESETGTATGLTGSNIYQWTVYRSGLGSDQVVWRFQASFITLIRWASSGDNRAVFNVHIVHGLFVFPLRIYSEV